MTKTYTLRTATDEVIDYNNIVVESSEDTVIPETTQTKKNIYTLGSVKQQLIDIASKIQLLKTEEEEIKSLYQLIVQEADKVTSAIK
jgi:hypothetical protein